MSHTPGPWSRSWIAGGIRHLNKNVDFEAFWTPDDGEDQNAANYPLRNSADYSLIASAPDLLAACKAFVQERDHNERRARCPEDLLVSGKVADAIEEAVRKAEGAA
jgi:hypothetical protein